MKFDELSETAKWFLSTLTAEVDFEKCDPGNPSIVVCGQTVNAFAFAQQVGDAMDRHMQEVTAGMVMDQFGTLSDELGQIGHRIELSVKEYLKAKFDVKLTDYPY